MPPPRRSQSLPPPSLAARPNQPTGRAMKSSGVRRGQQRLPSAEAEPFSALLGACCGPHAGRSGAPWGPLPLAHFPSPLGGLGAEGGAAASARESTDVLHPAAAGPALLLHRGGRTGLLRGLGKGGRGAPEHQEWCARALGARSCVGGGQGAAQGRAQVARGRLGAAATKHRRALRFGPPQASAAAMATWNSRPQRTPRRPWRRSSTPTSPRAT